MNCAMPYTGEESLNSGFKNQVEEGKLLKTLSRALMRTYLNLGKFIDSSVENGLGEGLKARQFRRHFAGPSKKS